MTDTAPARWGRQVAEGVVDRHPCRVYARRPDSVAELLLDARRWSDREFVVQGRRRLSVTEFGAAVARVAQRLRAEGVVDESRVAIVGFNSIEWLAAFWALQTIGATAVLGNAWWSDAEVRDALEQSEPVLSLTDRDVPGPRLGLSDLRGAVDAPGPAELELTQVAEESTALIMFSSGTTGSAKGVVMSQRSVVANIQNLLVLTGRLPDELDPERPGTVSLLTVPLFHLAGIQISCTTLLSGGRLIFLDGKFDPAETIRLIEHEVVRVWGSIPTMVSRVLDEPSLSAHDTSSLSSVPMGGAAIPPHLRKRISASFSGVRHRVGSLYGLTEAGGVLAAGSGEDISTRPGCVGRALPVVELRITEPDSSGEGEIQARTPTATGGYLGAEAPVGDPDGWIGTGDRGRLDADGWLYVTGRSKDIIIRGGENIASAHVEEALAAHPDVVEVAVVALPDADLGEAVAAAVVLRPDARTDIAELRAYAGERLGRFELPSHWWLRRDPLPTNATGKIVRRDVAAAWLRSGVGDIREDR